MIYDICKGRRGNEGTCIFVSEELAVDLIDLQYLHERVRLSFHKDTDEFKVLEVYF